MIGVSIAYTAEFKGATRSDIFLLRMGRQFARRRPEKIGPGYRHLLSWLFAAAITSIMSLVWDGEDRAAPQLGVKWWIMYRILFIFSLIIIPFSSGNLLAESNVTPMEILRKSEKIYENCKSYSDEGYVKTIFMEKEG